MKVIKFCPVDGYILDDENICPSCGEVAHPIAGQFTEKDAKRLLDTRWLIPNT